MTDNTQQIKPDNFLRTDETDDQIFYKQPRLVAHIDDPACAALNDYFREHLPADSDLLDLMSSCVSHLPWDVDYKSVTGLGMNQVELDDNTQLTDRLVHNLNTNPMLPMPDNIFDGCMLTVSVQYLIDPVSVFTEISRVLRPGSQCIVSFSNRCFPTKAIALWNQMDDFNHAKLVGYYFNESGGFKVPKFENISPNPNETDPLFVVSAITKSD